MISPTDLNYFSELARTLHLTRAAERIGISQPALSHCLKKMEIELGVELFTRSKKGLSLTAAGLKLNQATGTLLQQWESVKNSVLEEVNEVKGLIRLGCHTAVASYMLTESLARFINENPGIELKLTHGLSRHLTEQVVSSTLDVAIAVNPHANAELIIEELCKDQVCFWQSRKNRNTDILILDPSLLQTQALLAKASQLGIHFRRTIESSSLEVIAELVAKGVGSGILPERVLRSTNPEKVERLPGTPHLVDRVCLVFKRDFRKLKRGQAFIQHFPKNNL